MNKTFGASILFNKIIDNSLDLKLDLLKYSFDMNEQLQLLSAIKISELDWRQQTICATSRV